jgi:F-type H+-transporting ATPase subunit delta
MQNPRLASRYAKSLLDLAVEQNSLDATLKDVQLMDGICRESRDFANVLRSPVIHADKKLQIIKAVLGTGIGALTQAFITLLVNKGREAALPEIAESFISQYKELKRIRTVKLTTATPVSDKVKEAIRSRVAAGLPDHTIELSADVNPDLIGGFVLEMEDKLFDASIRRDLNDIKSQFLKNAYVSELR